MTERTTHPHTASWSSCIPQRSRSSPIHLSSTDISGTSMPVRRTHRKSRNGCLLCKQRRVKCDEAGPPCGNCKARGTECQYAHSESGSPNPPIFNFATPPTTHSHLVNPGSALPSSRQLLELQLLHRWTTVTCLSISNSVARDHDTWQTVVPGLALQYDFLLHGLFAISAFDMASSYGSHGSQYVSAALEYQDLAIRGFQAHLRGATHDSQEASLYFSIVLMVLSLASAQFVSTDGGWNSMIQNTVVHFELVRGIGTIMAKSKDSINKHPLFCYLDPITQLNRTALDPTLETFLAKLNDLNDKREASKTGGSAEARVKSMLYSVSCKKALFWLQECFATCVGAGYRDYCLGWPSLAGEDYISAIKDKDTVALLILMYWSILVNRLRYDYWWASDYGKSLIEEISNIVSNGADRTMKEAVAWAQQQVYADINREFIC